jgi:hypothetical protein
MIVFLYGNSDFSLILIINLFSSGTPTLDGKGCIIYSRLVFSEKLVVLDLSSNELSGPIPSKIAETIEKLRGITSLLIMLAAYQICFFFFWLYSDLILICDVGLLMCNAAGNIESMSTLILNSSYSNS